MSGTRTMPGLASEPAHPSDGIDSCGKIGKQGLEGPAFAQESRSRKLEQVRKLLPSKVGHFERAYSGNSMGAAINANCLDCMGYDSSEVERCHLCDCPFWEYRPYQKRGGSED